MFNSSGKALALGILSLLALPAGAADSVSAETAEVKVTVIFPATLNSFDNLSVKVFLDQSQPPAPGADPNTTYYQVVDTQESDKVSHVKGTESKVEVTVGTKVQLDANLKYMVLARVLDDPKTKGIAMFQGKPTVMVLTGGGPNAVTMTVTHVNK